jgi:hypothetical protein
MNLRRSVLTALLALGIVLGVAVPAGATQANHGSGLQCGVNPTSDVRLRADLTCTDGFRIDPANHVDVDLAGHRLTVTNGACTFSGPCGAIYGAASVTNGAVSGDLKDVTVVRKVRVTGSVYFEESTAGPSMLDRSVVRKGRVGIFGPDDTISRNDILGVGPLGGGIELIDSLRNISNVSITGNRIVGAGIRAFDSCGSCPGDISGVIAYNSISESTGNGIDLSGFLPSLGRIEITANTVRDNAGDGISISSLAPAGIGGGPVVLTGNRLIRNGGHGVNSTWTSTDPTLGVIDGGGNVARRNGLAPACIGITCSLCW